MSQKSKAGAVGVGGGAVLLTGPGCGSGVLVDADTARAIRATLRLPVEKSESSGCPTKTYLGDSVYAEMLENEFGGFKLTTENGAGVSNLIYLEPSVFASLVEWVAYQRARARSESTGSEVRVESEAGK